MTVASLSHRVSTIVYNTMGVTQRCGCGPVSVMQFETRVKSR